MPTKPTGQDSTIEDQVKHFAPPEEFGAAKVSKLSRAEMMKLADAVLAFGQALCDTKLYAYQQEFGLRIVSSLLFDDGEEITGLFSRQSGKTETLAVVVCGVMVMLPCLASYIDDPRIKKFSRGVWVGIFAPTRDQGETLHGRIIEKMQSDGAREIMRDPSLGIHIDDSRFSASVNLPNGSFVQCRSAAKQARIEGKTYHLILLEESQDINPLVYSKAISPMGASTNASQAKIGTPNMIRSDFYDACQRNINRDSNLRRGDLRNHYQFDYETACLYNPLYRKYVAKEIGRQGYDSDSFRMAYRLHWILERGMFIEQTLFEMLGKDYSPITYDTATECVAGFDVGKSDASSVLTVIAYSRKKGREFGEDNFHHYKRVMNWLEMRGDDYVSQVSQAKNFLSNYHGLKKIMIDATGVGSAVSDMLKHALKDEIEAEQLEVVDFIATTQSNNDGYQHLLTDFQNALIEYPNSTRAKASIKQRNFVQQVTNLQKDYIGSYLTATAGSTTEFKDFASSLMMAILAADTDEGMREVEEDVNLAFTPSPYSRRTGLASQRGKAAWTT